ncbi:MAG: glycosyltransferase N-terminal domain-containing protein [Ignavibacteria bacterium]|jgi:3-deoxy-D-manno-octulosonic-acid transferase
MKLILFSVYDYLVLPLLFISVKILSIVNAKVKKGLNDRKNLFEKLRTATAKLDGKNKTVWFHSSSMGEFEQAKPIIQKLKEEKKINIVVSFFSPSGYENSKRYPYADVVTYIPLDTRSNAVKFIEIINPDIAVFMRYDIWPNIVLTLKKNNIPAFIVDATMRNNTPRKLPFVKKFHKIIYSYFTKILTVSEEDVKNFAEFNLPAEVVKAVGDTRFDRVYQKSLDAKEKKLFPDHMLNDKKIFVAGSSWEADEEVVIPAVKKMLSLDEDFIVIIVPHEPTVMHLEKLEHQFYNEFKTIRFSYLNNYLNERVILIDLVGILLTLYYYADVAYVGGSFKQGIHNVLEPAVYGIPVLYGPKIENSREAIILAGNGCCKIVSDKKEMFRSLKELTQDENLRKKNGKICSDFVSSNVGATKKIVKEINSYI